jgi:hypothetical protein
MPAFLSGAIARVIIFAVGTLILGIAPSKLSVKSLVLGIDPAPTRISIKVRADSAEVEKVRRELDSLQKEADALKNEAKALKISITDKGLKVGSEDGREIEFTVDLEDIGGELGEHIEELEGWSDSIADFVVGDDERYFVSVRGRDLVRFGEDVHVPYFELVRGNVVVIGGDLRIDGKVMGDVVNIFGRTTLSSSAIVNGEVLTIMGHLARADDAVIGGETVTVGGEGCGAFAWPFASFGSGLIRILGKVVVFVIMALLLLIVVYFLRDRMKRTSTLVFGSFLKSLGVGFLVVFVGTILVAVLAAILAITIIGIPVSILLILSLVALIVIGYFVSALALGEFLVAKLSIDVDSPLVQGLIGLFALALLGLISSIMFFNPFLMPVRVLFRSVGAFINFLAVLAGVGAFVLSRAGGFSKKTKPELTA